MICLAWAAIFFIDRWYYRIEKEAKDLSVADRLALRIDNRGLGGGLLARPTVKPRKAVRRVAALKKTVQLLLDVPRQRPLDRRERAPERGEALPHHRVEGAGRWRDPEAR